MNCTNYINYQSECIAFDADYEIIHRDSLNDGEIKSDFFGFSYKLEMPKATYLEGRIRGEEDCAADYRSVVEESALCSDILEVEDNGYFAVIQTLSEEQGQGVCFKQ